MRNLCSEVLSVELNKVREKLESIMGYIKEYTEDIGTYRTVLIDNTNNRANIHKYGVEKEEELIGVIEKNKTSKEIKKLFKVNKLSYEIELRRRLVILNIYKA